MKVSIDDIRIPYYYLPPNPKHYNDKYNNYKKGGILDPIIVTNDMYIADGYISYLILKEAGAHAVDVYYDDEMPVLYINGNHPSSEKLYTWYVPRRLRKSFQKKISVGDTVKCRANNKITPVIVREIYMRNEKDDKIMPVISL